MYLKFATLLLIVLMTDNLYSQTVAGTFGPNGVSGTYGQDMNSFSSTPAEGWWRGAGAYMSGVANWLQAMGAYENLHEMARQKYMQNEYDRIQARRALRDQGEARRLANKKDYITKEHARLDQIERMAQLEKRKEEMRAAGKLPAKKPTRFVWGEHSFASYAEFRNSPHYREFLDMRHRMLARQATFDALDEQKQELALRILKKYRGMSEIDAVRLQEQIFANEVLSR